MRKTAVGMTLAALVAIPTGAALAAELPAMPTVPGIGAGIPFLDLGHGLNGTDGAVDPTAGHVDDDVTRMGPVLVEGLGGPDGLRVAVQVGQEGSETSVGRVGVAATNRGLQVYLEDFTQDDVIAGALSPVLALISADPDCPPAGARACDAALITVLSPVELPLPGAPAVPRVPGAPALPTPTGALPAASWSTVEATLTAVTTTIRSTTGITLPTAPAPRIPAVPIAPATVATVAPPVAVPMIDVSGLEPAVTEVVDSVLEAVADTTNNLLGTTPQAPTQGLLGGLLG